MLTRLLVETRYGINNAYLEPQMSGLLHYTSCSDDFLMPVTYVSRLSRRQLRLLEGLLRRHHADVPQSNAKRV